jgi:CRP-like cAMP-binding protein
MQILTGSSLIDQFGIDYFKGGSTFGALSEKAIRSLLLQGVLLKLEQEEPLYYPDDPGDCFYIILKGTVRFFTLCQEEIHFSRDFVFGEQLGFVPMIALHKRKGTAQAVEESIVLKVCSSLFFELHEKLPNDFGILLLNLSREMARQIGEYTLPE